MAMIRPGGDALTKKAVEKAKLPAGARILDVGCGEGDTAAMLAERYGFDVAGVDQSEKLIDKGKARHPGLDLRRMEAEFLDFESKSFDAVIMECSLSVFRLQEDAAFEAWCMLKDGGKLIITDLYRRNPDPVAVAKMLKDAHEKSMRPKVDGACGENTRPSKVMLDGAFVVDELAAMLTGVGFEFECSEDESNVLPGFAAQAIMGHGSLEEYFKAIVPEGEDPSAYCACSAFCPPDEGEPAGSQNEGTAGKKTPVACKTPEDLGYFLMILKKQS